MNQSRVAPDVDYLTRDYEGFQKLLVSLLDRSSTEWTERAAADLGVMLVEILANQLDHLAYAGDRVAEEAFLPTARRREYARRHAALGDHRLERGNATSGWQYFCLTEGSSYELPAGTQLGQKLVYGDDPEARLIFETSADAHLDARLNAFGLERSVASGASSLYLALEQNAAPDLKSLGLKPGARLCILDPVQDRGEWMDVLQISGNRIELRAPLGSTYLADTAKVLGNLAPIRRGRTRDWEFVGLGGLARTEMSAQQYWARRLDLLFRLRAEVEAARPSWIADTSLLEWWTLANAEISCGLRELRSSGGILRTEDELSVAGRLSRAAGLFQEMLEACGRIIPASLLPSERVAIPRQEIRLPGTETDLWLSEMETLRVKVIANGHERIWVEQEDLLRSGSDDPHYVVEIDELGYVTLHFGDGKNGAMLPPDSRVMARRVLGDLFGGDLGANALTEVVGESDAPRAFKALLASTTNPLPTEGARKPEALRGELTREVQRGLGRRAIPVTLEDYRTVLLDHSPDIAEISVALLETREPELHVAGRRVDVVLRPRPGKEPGQVLRKAGELLRVERLAGTEVGLRLCEPLFVSIALCVEVHPEISASDLRLRLRRELLSSFGGSAPNELGRARRCSEIYGVAESVPGVIYSQVIVFDLASRPEQERGVEELIQADRHQIVRCLGLPDNPLCGDVEIWAARRFRLMLVLGYPDPDGRPEWATLNAMLMELFSGRDARPLREGWGELSPARMDKLIEEMQPHGTTFRLKVQALLVGEQAVSRLVLQEGELPILDGIQIEERPYWPHFGLQIALPMAPSDEAELRRRIAELFSGPLSIPVKEQWSELSASLVAWTLKRVIGLDPSTLDITVANRRVHRIRLEALDVPVLDGIEIKLKGDEP